MEFNPYVKKWRKGLKRIALVYPNRYIGGIANVGLQFIYAYLNSLENCICERFYSDVFEGLRSMESGTHLREFDVALFSLQYEEDYFKAVEILERSGFKGMKIAGGPCAMINPRPLKDFFDAFIIGEVEKSNVLDLIVESRSKEELKDLKGIWTGHEERVKRIKPKKLDFYLGKQIIGESAFGKCILLEVGRGCFRRCRFCVVRQIYSPVRWRDPDILLDFAESHKGLVDKCSLIAPSVGDYPDIKKLTSNLIEMGYMVSPSSIRADTVDEELMEMFAVGGLKSFTIAPEAGSQRLRDILGKDLSEEDIMNAASIASEKGIKSIKLYFMIGLPKETKEDLKELIELAKKIKRLFRDVSISINPLVPKPHTPFQWLPYTGFRDFLAGMKELKRRIDFLKKELSREFDVSVSSPDKFAIQTILSRGGEEVCNLIRTRKQSLRIAKDLGLLKYLGEIPVEDKLPWDFIDHGYSKSRLIREYEKTF